MSVVLPYEGALSGVLVGERPVGLDNYVADPSLFSPVLSLKRTEINNFVEEAGGPFNVVKNNLLFRRLIETDYSQVSLGYRACFGSSRQWGEFVRLPSGRVMDLETYSSSPVKNGLAGAEYFYSDDYIRWAMNLLPEDIDGNASHGVFFGPHLVAAASVKSMSPLVGVNYLTERACEESKTETQKKVESDLKASGLQADSINVFADVWRLNGINVKGINRHILAGLFKATVDSCHPSSSILAYTYRGSILEGLATSKGVPGWMKMIGMGDLLRTGMHEISNFKGQDGQEYVVLGAHAGELQKNLDRIWEFSRVSTVLRSLSKR